MSRLICFAMLFVLLCANLSAQETAKQPMRLSPDEAVQLAIKNNLNLETARVNTATKKRASDLSWNQFLPSITVTGALSVDNEASTTTASGVVPITWDMVQNYFPPEYQTQFEMSGGDQTMYNWVTSYSATIDNPRWNFAIPIQVSLNLSAAMFSNMKRLRLDYEGGLVSYEKTKSQLERDVRKAYHNMLLLQQNIELLRISYENVGRQVQMAQANYNAGLVPELTYLQALVARENMRPTMDQVENGYKLSMAQFAMFLGLDYNTPFELIPVETNTDFIPLDLAEMISKASREKPDIQELRHTILMLQSARKTQINSLLPFLSLSWGMTNYYTPPIKVMENSVGGWGRSGSLTVAMGIRVNSLLPFSSDFQGVKNLDDQIATVNLGLAQLVHGTEIEVYNTVLALERTRTSAQAQAQTVSLAEQSYRLTEQAYQAGLQDYFQVQNAQQSLLQAQVQMLEQQFNYLNGLLDLEYSIGVPFGTLSKGSR